MHYKHLMSPVRLGTRLLKSRLFFANAFPHMLQGPENYPAEPVMTFYENIARNGAALIYYQDQSNPDQPSAPNIDARHYPCYDLEDYGVQNYMSQLADRIHCQGSLIATDIFTDIMMDHSVSGTSSEHTDERFGAIQHQLAPDVKTTDDIPASFGFGAKKAFTEAEMDALLVAVLKKATLYKSFGFDAGVVDFRGHMGEFLSPATNTRTDQYGGSYENRARYPLRVLKTLRKELGPDFLLMGNFGSLSSLMEYEDIVQFLKDAAPYMDVVQSRTGFVTSGYLGGSIALEDNPCLKESVKLKASGINIPISAWTGADDAGEMELAIEKGCCDFVVCGRLMLANPDFGTMITMGKGDELVPCIRCNKCHGLSMSGPWRSVCSVNPMLGRQHYPSVRLNMTTPKRKVAIVGGGPAGMWAAIEANKKGHEVTLYEAADRLGGQLATASIPSFKWGLRKLLDYMIKQVSSGDIHVRLSTPATEEVLKKEQFDVVIAAVGAKERMTLDVGAEQRSVGELLNEKQLRGKRIVVIGSEAKALEAAIHAAEQGGTVTLLSDGPVVAPDSPPIHSWLYLWGRAAETAGLTIKKKVVVEGVENRTVYYCCGGKKGNVSYDIIVTPGIRIPPDDEVLALNCGCTQFFVIGDCKRPGSIMDCTTDAWNAVRSMV